MPTIKARLREESTLSMLTGQVDHIIGVDTHRDHHTLAVVDPNGSAHATTQIVTDAFGYWRMLAFARAQAPGRRVWAIEGTGSFGAGLTCHLLENGEWVVEIDRPKRPARRNGAKTNELDAVRACREDLAREHLAQPRRRGDREAVRVLLTTRQGTVVARTKAICQLKALLVGAPEQLRQHFRGMTTDQQLERCARLRTVPSRSAEHRATVRALPAHQRPPGPVPRGLSGRPGDRAGRAGTGGGPDAAGPARRGRCVRGPDHHLLVAPRSIAQRGGVRVPGRGSPDTRQLGPDHSTPPEPLR